MRGTATDAVGTIFANPPLTTTQTNKLEWFGTARVRAGWLVTPSTLIYGTAGLAYGEAKASTNVIVGSAPGCPFGNGFCAVGSVSDTRLGWTAGGGFETMLGANWTAKVEYLYYNLGSVTEPIFSTAPALVIGSPETMQAKARFDGNIVRAGLNYKFN
jgi:outer membrane immunogenic protein